MVKTDLPCRILTHSGLSISYEVNVGYIYNIENKVACSARYHKDFGYTLNFPSVNS